MKYRILGKTGMKVSVVGMGTWQFGGEWGKDYEQNEVNAMFDKAEEVGMNLIDTAECYGDHLSEKFIGEAIRSRRDKFILATKFGHHFHDKFTRDVAFEPNDVKQQLEASLKALQTDYVDLYQFHSGSDDAFDSEGLWNVLNDFVKEGKVRHLGISIGSNKNIYQTDKAAKVGAETIQVVYNRINRGPEKEVLPSCLKQQLGVLARVPLASGFLSGKYQPGASFASDDVREKWYRDGRDEKLELVQKIASEEVPEGVPMAQWALGWVLKHDEVTCVIPGCKNVEQVESNAAAADLEMVKADHPQGVS